MDFVQIPNPPVEQDQPAQPLIARGALGTVGNLQFSVQDEGTAPEPRPGRLSRIGSWCTDLSFLCCVSDEAHYQHDDEREVFENSRRVGDLLGSLTAHAHDPAGLTWIAQQLAELCRLSQGDLAILPGGRESLSDYMDKLTARDIQALREGLLRAPQGREAIRNQITHSDVRRQADLRRQADSVLTQVEGALRQREARDVVTEALTRIAQMPSPPENRAALRTDLEIVQTNWGQLRGSLQTLNIVGQVRVRDLQSNMAKIYNDLLKQRKQDKEELIKEQRKEQINSARDKEWEHRCGVMVEEARNLGMLVREVEELISAIMPRSPNNEELDPPEEELSADDRSQSLDSAEVKTDEPSDA